MATLTKDPTSGLYVVKQGDTLSKIATNSGRTLSELIANNPQYKSNPNMIKVGDSVNTLGPTYSSLATGNIGGSSAPSAPTPEPLSALISKMIKDSQTTSGSQFINNEASLLKGKEKIGETNSGLYSKDLTNPNLTVSDRLNVLNSSGNLQGDGLKSIDNQMKINESRYKTSSDLIKTVQDLYAEEADRRYKEKESERDQKNIDREFNENKRQFNETNRLNREKAGVDLGTGSSDPTVNSWVALIQSGQAKISSVPAKYKDAVARGLSSATMTIAQNSGVLDALNLSNQMLSNDELTNISGPLDQYKPILFGKAAEAKNQYEQLKGFLALENRQKLKGTGAISDFESKTLERASSALGRNLGDAEFINQTKQVRGALTTASGLEADVLVTDPKTGDTKAGKLDRQGINEAISGG